MRRSTYRSLPSEYRLVDDSTNTPRTRSNTESNDETRDATNPSLFSPARRTSQAQPPLAGYRTYTWPPVHPPGLSHVPLSVQERNTYASQSSIRATGAPEPSVSAPPGRKKRSTSARILLGILFLGFVLSIVAGGRTYRYVSDLEKQLPLLPDNPAATLAESTVILASDGSEIGYLFGERRTWVDLAQMSPYVIDALLAAEDHRFFEHEGIDYRRILGALWKTINGDPEGASTIPMQLARNYFPEIKKGSTADRKVQELLLARLINDGFSKEETLEWYLNTVAFGHNSFGIQAAAERFFSRDASDLELSQAALLIGMLKGPSRYDPFSHAMESSERRNLVLARMAELGFVTSIEAQDASSAPVGLSPRIYDPASSIAPHFVDYVKREARAWARLAGYDLKRDGLVIHTSLDPELQRAAIEAVDRQAQVLQNVITNDFGLPGSTANARFWRNRAILENDLLRSSEAYHSLVETGFSDFDAMFALRSDKAFLNELRGTATTLEAGFVAINPHSGQIKAWVGGRDYRQDQFDKVAMARRQPGSAFKPFVYAAAIERGFSPHYLVRDRVRTFVTNTRGERWTPTNSGGGASGRLMSLEHGLAWSVNTVSAHLISQIGPQAVVDLANKMGIKSSLLPVPSLALGTSETTLLEMVSSFATFAEYGIRRNVTVITSIQNRDGKVIAMFPSEPRRVLSEQTAFTMLDMMRKVINNGTGSYIRNRFQIKGDLAGKTGTTQNNADGWFIGMHPDLVVGAWVGFNDPRVSFQSDYWGQGGHNALLLVGDFLKTTTEGPGAYLKRSRFTAPEGYRYPSKPIYSKSLQTSAKKSNILDLAPSKVTPKTSSPTPIPLLLRSDS